MASWYLNIASIIIIICLLWMFILEFALSFKQDSYIGNLYKQGLEANNITRSEKRLLITSINTALAMYTFWQFHFGDIAVAEWLLYVYVIIYFVRALIGLIVSYMPKVLARAKLSNETVASAISFLIFKIVIIVSLIIALTFNNN